MVSLPLPPPLPDPHPPAPPPRPHCHSPGLPSQVISATQPPRCPSDSPHPPSTAFSPRIPGVLPFGVCRLGKGRKFGVRKLNYLNKKDIGFFSNRIAELVREPSVYVLKRSHFFRARPPVPYPHTAPFYPTNGTLPASQNLVCSLNK